MRRFLIDTDTGSDDAVALVLAFAARDVSVEAITVVAGNVPIDQAVQNALYTRDLCGSPVPVYAGSAKPMLRALQTAEHVHGRDGMGDIGLPLAGRVPAAGHAVDAIRAAVNAWPGELEIVTLGPLTNLAVALLCEPGLAAKVRGVTIMGGTGDGRGNITPVAEFNVWVDPEAAAIVFASGMPIVMVGWDVARIDATFDPDEAEAIRRAGGRVAAFCVDIQRELIAFSQRATGSPTFDFPDPLAMAVALDPGLIAREVLRAVEVDITSGPGRGQTIVDWRGAGGRTPNVRIVESIAREQFVARLHAAVAAFD